MKFLASLFLACIVLVATHAQNNNQPPHQGPLGEDDKGDVCTQSEHGMADDKDVTSAMGKICEAAGIPNNFTLQQCKDIDNCRATIINNTSYILYDLNFFKKIESYPAPGLNFTSKALPKTGGSKTANQTDGGGNIDWDALTILSHELGHHLCQHFSKTVYQLYTPVQMELQADEYAGRIMYRLGATLDQAQHVMNSPELPDDATLTHPARKDRLYAIEQGWEKEDAYRRGGQPPVADNQRHEVAPPLPLIMPSVMVLPHVKQGMSIQTLMDSDENVPLVLTKIKEAFDSRKFTTVDFAAKLAQAQALGVFKGVNIADEKSKLVENAGIDMYVEAQLFEYSNNGVNRARLVLQAYDVSSALSLVNMDCQSNQNRSSDWQALFSSALSVPRGDSAIACREIFLNKLQESITRLNTEGRPIILQIGFAPGSHYDGDYLFGDKQLNDILNDWLDKNAMSYSSGGATKTAISYNEVRIHYYNELTRKPYRVDQFILELIHFLNTAYGIKATRDVRGGTINITIH